MLNRLIQTLLLTITLISCFSFSLFAKISLSDEQIEKLTKEEIKVLLESNAYFPEKISNSGDTMIHSAAKKNDITALKLGFIYGIDPKIPNKSQNTPLHIAAEKGNIEIVNFLVEQGVSIFWPNLLGQTPYHKALQNDHKCIMDRFIELGYLPGDEVIDYLIALGFNPSVIDNSGNTALHKAALTNNIPVIEKLLAKGWEIDSTNKSGKNALMLAVSKGHLQTVRFLLAHGSNVNAKDNLGDTALIICIKKQQDVLLSILLESNGINPDLLNIKGICALHYAVGKGSIYSVQTLLQFGANVNIQTDPTYWSETQNWTRDDWDFDAGDYGYRGRDPQSGYLAPKATPLGISLNLLSINTVIVDLLKNYKGTNVYIPQLQREDAVSLEEYLK